MHMPVQQSTVVTHGTSLPIGAQPPTHMKPDPAELELVASVGQVSPQLAQLAVLRGVHVPVKHSSPLPQSTSAQQAAHTPLPQYLSGA